MALAKPSGGWLCILLLPMMQAFAQTPGTPPDPCTSPSLFDRSAGCGTSPNSNLERMDDALTELYVYYGVQAVISERPDRFITNDPGLQTLQTLIDNVGLVGVKASDVVAQLQGGPDIAATLNEVGLRSTCTLGDVDQADLIICLLDDHTLDDTDRQTLRDEAFPITAAALQELSPAPYDLAARSGRQLIRSLARLARNRLTRLHNSPPPADTVQLDGQSPLVASAAPTATTVALMGLTGMDVQARRAHYQANPLTAWAQGFSSYSSQDAEDLLHDFEHRQNGLVVGADRKIGERLLAGGYLGGGVMDTSFAGGDNHEALLYSAGLYGMVIGPSRRSYLDLELGLHYMDHEQQREIRLGDQRTTTQADYSALAFSLRAGTGIMFDIRRLILEPELSIAYMYQNIDGFTESGDSPALLQVGEQQSQLVSWRAGINMHREFTTGGGNYVYTPRVGFHYLVETDLADREIPARFAIIPRDSGYFTLRGRDNARHYYQQDIGINVSSADGDLQAHGDYTFIGNDKLTEHQFNVGLRYHFK